MAWFSTAGFHHRSRWTTWLAAVRVSPVPPALSESSMIDGPVARLETGDQLVAALLPRATVQERDLGVEAGRQVRHEQVPNSVNCVKHSTRSPSARISARISSRRTTLPDRRPIGGAVVQELGGVVADLLQLGHRGEHVAAALDALRVLDLLHHVVDDRAVERGLLRREPVVLRDLDLVGQVVDDGRDRS